MERRFQIDRVLLVVLTTVNVTHTTTIETFYDLAEPGQSIAGTIAATYTTHVVECSRRCSSDVKCVGYQHAGTGPGNCLLIIRNSTADEDGQTFVTQGHTVLYKKGCTFDCKNGGRCVDGIQDVYQCLCSDGYSGINCETEIDECDSMPCVHGNCTNNINSYSSMCNPGYTGINCETEKDECKSMPCVHGNCSDTINSYTCQCNPGYTGINCETDIDECESTPCVHGNCSDMMNMYKCICPSGYFGLQCESCNVSGPWDPPAGWTGPDPVVYRSFDCPDGLMMMEGNQQANLTFIAGKKNDAISLPFTKNQWVDVIILTEACMTRPEICGDTGGAVAFWMRITYMDGTWRGIFVASRLHSTRIFIGLDPNNSTSHTISILDGRFVIYANNTSGWTHIVLNYIGPNNGQGIRAYHDGVQVGSDTTKEPLLRPSGDGRVEIGKWAGVDVDELLFFNETLSNQEIIDITNMV